jgi:hypothetical protein
MFHPIVLLQALTWISTICVCSFTSCAGSSSSEMSNVRYLGLCSVPPDTLNKLHNKHNTVQAEVAAATEAQH